ncbi:MAG: methionine--tRNA ligase [Myxococcota bacterium]|nr:methionine--tRNA ligase [Myxococcota bacterium]
MSSVFYVTTPIYYANAEPHLGHTYTTVVADMLVRWNRMHGREAWSVSGTDEHGEKMVEAAEKAGTSPQAFTEQISAVFQRTWAELGIGPSAFVRTTNPKHVANVTKLLQKVWDEGWIELREYEGLYCVGCERFLTERDMKDGLCIDHERAPERRRETNYFFLMSRAFGWLRQYIEEHPDFIRPERYRNEALAMLRDESGLGDLSISRPKDRLDWGVELPFDRDHVCYVWFDALISYLTGAGYPDDPAFEARWAVAEHLIAKDILKPHAIFWPCMLHALGIPPYKHLSVHGYWNVDDRKISKSLGNVIRPLAMRDRFGFDAFRYFLLRDMSFGVDSVFTEDALVARINADLANNLGNLVSRTLNMTGRFCDGRVPEPEEPGEAEDEVRAAAETAARAVDEHVEKLEPARALEAIMRLVDATNRYVDQREPWKAAKDESRAGELRTTLFTCCQSLRAIAVLLLPFVPDSATEILSRLGVPELADEARLPDSALGFELPAPGTETRKGAPLFPRIDSSELSEGED